MAKRIYKAIQPRKTVDVYVIGVLLALVGVLVGFLLALWVIERFMLVEAPVGPENVSYVEPLEYSGICLTEGLSPINTICIREEKGSNVEQIEPIETVSVNNDAPGVVEPPKTEEKPRFTPSARPVVNRSEGTVQFGGGDDQPNNP